MNEPWRISLLGGLRIEGNQTTITRFNSQKTAGLLAYLAYHLRQMHAREVLIDIFWPDGTTEASRHSLSVALSTLRNQLEPPGAPTGSVIRADRYSVGLNPVAVTTDVAEFEAAIRAAAAKTTSKTEQVQLLSKAIDLFQGRLLPGYYEEWITTEQERLSGRFFDAVSQLLTHLEEIGDITAALSYARKAVSINPLREEGHQSLMRLLVAAGQPGPALRQYKELERLLEKEMGEEPSAPLRALARQIEKQSGLSQPVVVIPLRSNPSLSPVPLTSVLGQSPLPVTLTFLMTDIEGSTRLWERAGMLWKKALETHHSLLRAEFVRFGGQEIKEAGDSFLVAFGSARKALACAVACQQTLMVQLWREEVGSIAVRMVLHTGDVEFKDGDYHGLVLHRASRMLTAAHGGQILLAEPTAALVRRDLDENTVRLVDLGVYRLRDVPTPERLFQADYPGMRQAQFPPLAAENGYAAALPLRFTRFFGRLKEIAELTEMLLTSEVRLVTITGPGGIGKTRLSLEVAEQMVEPLAGAVYFVPLADILDPRLIAGSVLDALRIPRSPSREPIDQAVDALSKRPSLLVLDNLEQLVDGGAEVVQTLISRAASVTILVTSRQLLGLAAEREFALSPLPTPGNGDAPEQLSVYESVRLFVDRAQVAKPDFQISSANAPAVAELVTRLEGIPLAIELAAARAQVLTPLQMLTQLDQRFAFLVSRKRDVAERHRTLQAAVDWSYRLLSPELQRFFARLSVFRGGWTVEAAEKVCEEPLALDYLAQLRECSLVLAEDSGPEMRFGMLATLGEFGLEQLAVEERIVIKRQHLTYFLRKVEQGDALYSVHLESVFWSDPHNYRAALRWARTGGDARAGLRMAGMLGHAWWWTGLLNEAVENLTDLLSREDTQDAAVDRARALYWSGWIVARLGALADSCVYYADSLRIYRQINHKRGTARALCALGDTMQRRGEHEEARACLEESRVLFSKLDDATESGAVLNDLGDLALRQGDYAVARRLYRESTAVSEGKSMIFGLRLAEIALLEGNYEVARAEAEAQVDAYRQASSPQRLGESLLVLSGATMHQNDLDLASAYCAESMLLFKQIGSKLYVSKALRRAAYIAVLQERMERAARILGADDSLCQLLGSPLPPCERYEYERNIIADRQGLGDKGFATHWEAGHSMTWEEAIAFALEEQGT